MHPTLTIPTTAAELAAYLNATNPTHVDVGRWPWHVDGPDGYELALAFERPQDAARIAALLSYIFSGPLAMGGEFDGSYSEIEAGHLFIFDCDTTKSQRDDIGDAWETASVMLAEGTPIRKTDKAGPGTRGTRKVAGIEGAFAICWR